MEFIAALGFLDHQGLCRKDEEGYGVFLPPKMLALVD